MSDRSRDGTPDSTTRLDALEASVDRIRELLLTIAELVEEALSAA